MKKYDKNPHFLDIDKIPTLFPTHKHSPEFWENLGRVIGTFGYLEFILKRAIFMHLPPKKYSDEEEFEKYIHGLEREMENLLTDQLSELIKKYKKAVQDNPDLDYNEFKSLISELEKARKIRNMLCHAAWNEPDLKGNSLPIYLEKGLKNSNPTIDIDYLTHVQETLSKIIVLVINKVTLTGWQFPGTGGPGKDFMEKPIIAY